MAKVTSKPDQVEFEIRLDETLLAAGLRSGVAFALACGGRAKCSTCRIWVEDGLDACSERTEIESQMAERLGLPEKVRLACQLKPTGDLAVRRLVLDETDLVMCSQLDRAVATRTGEAKHVTILFSDIVDFTSVSQRLSPYDVMYLLNRYFVEIGDIVERNDGFIDKFVGDGLMAVFGIEDRANAPLKAVNTALQFLESVDRIKPFFESMYGIEFDKLPEDHASRMLAELVMVSNELELFRERQKGGKPCRFSKRWYWQPPVSASWQQLRQHRKLPKPKPLSAYSR